MTTLKSFVQFYQRHRHDRVKPTLNDAESTIQPKLARVIARSRAEQAGQENPPDFAKAEIEASAFAAAMLRFLREHPLPEEQVFNLAKDFGRGIAGETAAARAARMSKSEQRKREAEAIERERQYQARRATEAEATRAAKAAFDKSPKGNAVAVFGPIAKKVPTTAAQQRIADELLASMVAHSTAFIQRGGYPEVAFAATKLIRECSERIAGGLAAEDDYDAEHAESLSEIFALMVTEEILGSAPSGVQALT